MKRIIDKKGGNGNIYFDNEKNTATKYLRNTSSLEKIQRFRQELSVLKELNSDNIPNIVEVLNVNIDEKTYTILSDRAYKYSQRNSEKNYISIIENAYYGRNKENNFKDRIQVDYNKETELSNKKERECVIKNENSDSKYLGDI